MKDKKLKYILIILMTLSMGLVLISCGSKNVNPPPPTISDSGGGSSSGQADTVSGVAATGAAMSGTVTLKDSNGTVRGPQAIGAGGSFSFDVTGLTPPFYIRAEDSSITGEVLYSVSMGPGTGNVNPLTNLIVAAAAGVNDPADVYNALLPISQDDLDTALGDIQDVLALLLDAYGANNVDPLTDPFTIGEGLDLLFDDVGVEMDVANGLVTFTDKSSETQLFKTYISDIVNVIDPLIVEVNGSGYATLSGGFRASLSLSVSDGALEDGTLSYTYEDDIDLSSTSITDISLEGSIATIKGKGTLFSDLSSEYTFTATITDGSSDSMGMIIGFPTSTSFATSTVHEITSQPLIEGDFTITLK